MTRFTPTLLAALGIAPLAGGQTLYDFDHLNGSDVYPYTLLDGQDGWSEETFNAANRCGVTATLSHDGTKSLRFQEVGPGYGCDASRINDAAWSFPAFSGLETTAYFQADMHVGFWGGSFGPAHDVDGNGQIRASEPGERGVRFVIGTQTNVQMRLVRADQTFVTVPLAGLGIGGGDWVRLRVVMDLGANGGTGSGSLEYLNITAGATSFAPVPGLQGVDLALDPAAIDATNPTLWDAVWLHFEGATYGLDNVEIGSEALIGTSYCGPAILNSTGLPGVVTASGSAAVSAGNVTLTAAQLPLEFGYFLNSQNQGFFNPPGSNGFICLGGAIGRHNQPGLVGQGPSFSIQLDLTALPQPAGTVAVQPGDTWNFQAWYRDLGNTNNFTDAVSITFL